jgi:hypothetical protein
MGQRTGIDSAKVGAVAEVKPRKPFFRPVFQGVKTNGTLRKYKRSIFECTAELESGNQLFGQLVPEIVIRLKDQQRT